MGIGDWGLGIGDWGLGPIPNPNPQIKIFIFKKNLNSKIKNYYKIKINNI